MFEGDALGSETNLQPKQDMDIDISYQILD